MSHELRAPLNAILGFCQLLDMEDLAVDQGEFVHQIGQGGGHLLKLINIVSADATERIREKAMSLGAFAYLTKPLDVGLLLDVLSNTLPPVH